MASKRTCFGNFSWKNKMFRRSFLFELAYGDHDNWRTAHRKNITYEIPFLVKGLNEAFAKISSLKKIGKYIEKLTFLGDKFLIFVHWTNVFQRIWKYFVQVLVVIIVTQSDWYIFMIQGYKGRILRIRLKQVCRYTVRYTLSKGISRSR